MTNSQKRAALLAMLEAARVIAGDLADDLNISHENLYAGRNVGSDSNACNGTVGALLMIEQAAKTLESIRAAAVALNAVRS